MPAQQTGIVWTDWTVNSWVGCAKISSGCKHCWAENMALRFDRTPEPWTIANVDDNLTVYKRDPAGDFATVPREGRWVFTPSSSDPCLPWLPDEARQAWLDALLEYDQHCYQVLTKWGAEDRGLPVPDLPDNVILGVSCETPRRRYRIDWLREQDAAMKFVSFEPLIERIDAVDLSGIDWIIVGGESHRDPEQRREMDPEWPIPLYEAAREQDAAFLFKQHSGTVAEQNRTLNVGDWRPREFDEFPETPAGVPDAPQEFLEPPEVAADG